MWCEAGKNLGAGEKRRAGSPVARRASLSLGFWLYLSLLYKPESQRRSRLGAHGPSGGLTGCWMQERGSDTSHLHPQPPAPSLATSREAGGTRAWRQFAECTSPILRPTVSLAAGRVSPRSSPGHIAGGTAQSSCVCACMRVHECRRVFAGTLALWRPHPLGNSPQ